MLFTRFSERIRIPLDPHPVAFLLSRQRVTKLSGFEPAALQDGEEMGFAAVSKGVH